MIYDLFQHYLQEAELNQRVMPLAVDVLSPDAYIYLYAGSKEHWYVIAEDSYFFMDSLIDDIEASFPIKVKGWYKLMKYQEKTGGGLLPAHSFSANGPDNWSDAEWDNYHGIVYQDDGIKYALLQVEPNPGISVKDFGLSLFREEELTDQPHRETRGQLL